MGKIETFTGWYKRQWLDRTAETAFATLGVVFGLLFVFLIPPTQAADETTHFYRGYQLSSGHILSHPVEVHGYGDDLPQSVYQTSRQLFADIPSHYERKFNYHQIPALFGQKINTSDQMPVHIEGASVYSPAGYIPQIIAILIAKIVWPSVVVMYYLGRIINLFLWLSLMYLAIRLWPGNKWAMFALALLPMSISQAATFSPDATINSLAFLIVSGAFYWYKRGTPLRTYEIISAVISVVWLSLCKPIFFVFGGLALLFGSSILRSRRRYVFFIIGSLGAAGIATALWNGQAQHFMVGMNYYYYPNVDIDSGRQLQGILQSPAQFMHALGTMYLSGAGNFIYSTFIGRLGWWDVDLPIWLVISVYILLLLAIVSKQVNTYRFSCKARLIAAAVFAAGFLALNGALYLNITEVGASYITGIQGRYLIALTPLLLPVFAGLLEVKNWNKLATCLYPISYSIILIVSLIVTINRFR
jgi:uncharacterized membrane protein